MFALLEVVGSCSRGAAQLPRPKVSDTTDFCHLTNLSGQNLLKADLEVGPVEELRWTNNFLLNIPKNRNQIIKNVIMI